jgi:hypothetical protein
MEREGLSARRKLPPPASAFVYELAARSRDVLPVLAALADWGAPELAERRPTDAVRVHGFAIPLLRRLEGVGAASGVVEVPRECRTGGSWLAVRAPSLPRCAADSEALGACRWRALQVIRAAALYKNT